MSCQVSIIIPTLDEEKYLPLLLKSIKNQDFDNYKIIVADAGSKDETLDIARSYNCEFIKGGLSAEGRNNGAKIAQGDLFLFLDADVVLPNFFLEKGLTEFKKRKLDIASFKLVPIKGKFASLFFNIFYNFPILLLEKILPHAAMGILIKKELFEKLNGFDETIKLAEDHELARRAKKLGKFGLIRSTELFVSVRRFERDGWFTTILKYFLCELYMIFIGPVKSDIFNYKFNHYLKKTKK